MVEGAATAVFILGVVTSRPLLRGAGLAVAVALVLLWIAVGTLAYLRERRDELRAFKRFRDTAP